MQAIANELAKFFMIFFIVIIAIYIAQAIFLSKFNKLVYGRGTVLAWIPICNIYLLGKLTVNKIVGWILVICLFATGSFSTTVNGVTKTITILPQNISSTISSIYSLAVVCLFIFAIIKYFCLKKSGNLSEQSQHQAVESINQVMQQPTPMQTMSQPVEQPTLFSQTDQNKE